MLTKHKRLFKDSMLSFLYKSIRAKGNTIKFDIFECVNETKKYLDFVIALFYRLKTVKMKYIRGLLINTPFIWDFFNDNNFILILKNSDFSIAMFPSSKKLRANLAIDNNTDINIFIGNIDLDIHFSTFDKIIQCFKDFDYSKDRHNFMEKLKQYCE